jgi:YidC/Oxa1 family membrane protein insertase
MPYVFAIISLTVLVRGCMFPLSRKQAISAAKMKELQPKINELKVKYGEDKQKIAQAQMELWRKHNINPLGGCFPLVFQLPVFIALYTALNTAMPPPTDEQQAAQQKMMNVMTLFFGFMFWHVPAGLCVYFIASSLWGIAERKLLGTGSTATVSEPSVTVKEIPDGKVRVVANGQNKADTKPGFFGRLMEAAEQAQRQAEKTKEKQNKGKKKGR